jgi:undecaprenyl-diphosphatase
MVDVVGDARALWSAAALIVAFLVFRQIRAALVFALVLLATIATVSVLKPMFERPSLIDQRGNYFPSTHAAGAMVICIAAATVLWSTRWRWPAIVVGAATVALYGAGLVSTRNHYPSDVVAGWCIAVGWTAAFRIFEVGAARLQPRAGH